MLTKLTLIVAALLLCPVAITSAAQIIVVTENVDKNLDRVADDQGLIDWLVAEGHSVDVRRNTWDQFDAKLIAQLNAADLIIVSRLANSGLYIHGDETTQWNSLKAPLLLMSAYFARNMRWNWVNSAVATNDTGDIYAVAVDPNHPVFRGIRLRPLDPNDPRDHTQVVQLVDPNAGSGITSFIGATDMGNGRLIARSVGHALGWIAEWDAGAEFYPGAGQFAGGKRMLFCAGTQEAGDALQGEFNLTREGRQVLHNAIAHLLGGANIILVTEAKDRDLDGLPDDHGLEAFLLSEGHFVDSRPYYWRELDPGKIAELKAADLIIFSRMTDSSFYDDGDEPTQWNSLPVPLLQMSAYFARNNRWEWVNSELTTNNTAVVYLEAVEPNHPIFDDVSLIALDSAGRKNPPRVVPVIDPNVGSGITSLMGTTRTGNGRLMAKAMGMDFGWIAEWDAGVEFYEGAGQYTTAKRLLFSAGTQEVEVVAPLTKTTMTTSEGELNLTPQGLQMFRNAIAYLRGPEPGPEPKAAAPTNARRR